MYFSALHIIHVDAAEDFLLSTDGKPQENHDFQYNPPALQQTSEISNNQSLSEEEPANPLALNPANSLLARSSFHNPFLSSRFQTDAAAYNHEFGYPTSFSRQYSFWSKPHLDYKVTNVDSILGELLIGERSVP